jgi:hypothetical protein
MNLVESDEQCILEGWVADFHDRMKPELKPWCVMAAAFRLISSRRCFVPAQPCFIQALYRRSLLHLTRIFMLCRVFCDSSGDHTYVNISIKGARLSNEDAICSDGRLFGVFDGHGGSVAALLAKSELPKHFYHTMDSQVASAAPKSVTGDARRVSS